MHELWRAWLLPHEPATPRLFAVAVCAALPYLQPQVDGLPMPAQLRTSQLVLAILEAVLGLWLVQQTWRAWAWLALQLGSRLGLVGALQQVRR